MVSTCVMVALICFTSGATLSSRVISERVDLVELNHWHDNLGRHAYDQVIFYKWSPDYRRFHVIAWFMVEHDLARVPTKLADVDEYVVNWYDRDAKVQRQVRAGLYRETFSQVDPEQLNRKFLDEKYRTSLLRVPQREVIR
jgi:hypothetical protein